MTKTAAKDEKHELPIESKKLDKLLVLAKEQIGGKHKLLGWFITPKLALDHKAPYEVIHTDKGYRKVMKLLREINE